MNAYIATLKRAGKKMKIRWQLAALYKEKNRMFFKLGYKTFSMYQDGDLTAEPLSEECRGIESIDEELESIELELAGLRAGKGSLPCRSCGVTLWEEGVFCPHCGERVSDEPLCHNCAHPVRESQGFCSQCGARVTVNEGVEKSD